MMRKVRDRCQALPQSFRHHAKDKVHKIQAPIQLYGHSLGRLCICTTLCNHVLNDRAHHRGRVNIERVEVVGTPE